MKPISSATNNHVVNVVVISICIMLNDLTDPTPIGKVIYMSFPKSRKGRGCSGSVFPYERYMQFEKSVIVSTFANEEMILV